MSTSTVSTEVTPKQRIAAITADIGSLTPPVGHRLETHADVDRWLAITGHRAPEYWSTHDTMLAVELVELQRRMRSLLDTIDLEGDVVYDEKGRAKRHPAWDVYRAISARDQRLRSMLGFGVHARGDNQADRPEGSSNGNATAAQRRADIDRDSAMSGETKGLLPTRTQ